MPKGPKGTHWNYRFCRETVPDGLGDHEEVWTLREIYYNAKGMVNGFSKEPMHPQGNSFIACVDDLAKMQDGLQGPCYIIDGDTLTEMPRGERFTKVLARRVGPACPWLRAVSLRRVHHAGTG